MEVLVTRERGCLLWPADKWQHASINRCCHNQKVQHAASPSLRGGALVLLLPV